MKRGITSKLTIFKDLSRAAQRARQARLKPATRKQRRRLAELLWCAGEDAYAIQCGWNQESTLLTTERAELDIDRYMSSAAKQPA